MSGGSCLRRSSLGFPYTGSSSPECLETLGFESTNLKTLSVDIGSWEEILSIKPSLTTTVVVVDGGKKEAVEVVMKEGVEVVMDRRMRTKPEMSRRRKKEIMCKEEGCCSFPPVLKTLKWNGRPGFNYVRRVEDDGRRLVITMEWSENQEVSRVATIDGGISFVHCSSSGDNDMGVVSS